MKHKLPSYCFLSLSGLIAGLFSTACAEDNSKFKVFDGRPKLVVANGYSTSHRPDFGIYPDLNGWPELIQRKFNRYYEGKNLIQIKNATKGSTPIAKWIHVETGEPISDSWPILQKAILEGKRRNAHDLIWVAFVASSRLSWRIRVEILV